MVGDIEVADYFAPKVNQLRVGDMIFAEGADDAVILVYNGAGQTSTVIASSLGGMAVAPNDGPYVAEGSNWVNSRTATSSLLYTWSTDTTATDPGVGGIKKNGAGTELYISGTALNSIDYSSVIGQITRDDFFIIGDFVNQSNNYVDAAVGAAVDNTGWFTLPIGNQASNGAITDGSIVSFGYESTAERQQPYINIIRTQDTTNNIVLTGTGSDDLWPPATPQPLTGGAYEGYRKIGNLVPNKEAGLTLVDGDDETGAALTACDIPITEDGTYRVDGFTTFAHPTNNSTVAFVFAVELGGVYIWSPRPIKHDMPNGGGNANLAGEGILSVPAGAVLSMWVASDNSGTVEFNTLSALIVKFAEL
jgi:hypothetical protein